MNQFEILQKVVLERERKFLRRERKKPRGAFMLQPPTDPSFYTQPANGSIGDFTHGSFKADTTPAITLPNTVAEGDAIILYIWSFGSDAAMVGPSGASELFQRVAGLGDTCDSGWWKKATVADVASKTLEMGLVPTPVANQDVDGSWGCWIVKPAAGVDFAVDSPVGAMRSTRTTEPNPPAVAVPTPGAYFVFPITQGFAQSGFPPAGYSEFFPVDYHSGSGLDLVVARGTIDIVTAEDPPPWGYTLDFTSSAVDSTIAVKATGDSPFAPGEHEHDIEPMTPGNAKGDLLVFDGTDWQLLPVGVTDGHVLTVAAAETLGIKWAASTGGGGGGTYASTIIADGPLAYYRLGESSGTAAVDAIAAANGTYNGTVTLGQSSLVGDADTSVDMVTDGYVAIPDLNDTGDWSIEFWINPDSLTDSRLISSTAGSFALRADSGTLQFFNGAVWESMGSHGMTTGNTYQIVLVKSGTTVTGYVNGAALASTFSYSGNVLDFTMDFGRNFSGFGNFFDGRMDEISLWSVALSSTQVADHYAAV